MIADGVANTVDVVITDRGRLAQPRVTGLSAGTAVIIETGRSAAALCADAASVAVFSHSTRTRLRTSTVQVTDPVAGTLVITLAWRLTPVSGTDPLSEAVDVHDADRRFSAATRHLVAALRAATGILKA